MSYRPHLFIYFQVERTAYTKRSRRISCEIEGAWHRHNSASIHTLKMLNIFAYLYCKELHSNVAEEPYNVMITHVLSFLLCRLFRALKGVLFWGQFMSSCFLLSLYLSRILHNFMMPWMKRNSPLYPTLLNSFSIYVPPQFLSSLEINYKVPCEEAEEREVIHLSVICVWFVYKHRCYGDKYLIKKSECGYSVLRRVF